MCIFVFGFVKNKYYFAGHHFLHNCKRILIVEDARWTLKRFNLCVLGKLYSLTKGIVSLTIIYVKFCEYCSSLSLSLNTIGIARLKTKKYIY